MTRKTVDSKTQRDRYHQRIKEAVLPECNARVVTMKSGMDVRGM